MPTMTEAPPKPAFEPSMRERVGTSPRTPRWNLATERRIDDGETLARGIGWFSVGLGLAQLAVGRRLAHSLGMKDRATLIQLFGLREIAQGAGILRSDATEWWMLARLAGDALDLAVLAPGLSPRNPERHRVQGTILAVAGATMLDVLCAYQLLEQRRRPVRDAAPGGEPGGRGEVSR